MLTAAYTHNAHLRFTSITITLSNTPEIAGSAYVRNGIIEVQNINATEIAAIIPPRAVFTLWFIFVRSPFGIVSAARNEVSAHTFAAAIGTDKSRADVAKLAVVALGGFKSAAALVHKVIICGSILLI